MRTSTFAAFGLRTFQQLKTLIAAIRGANIPTKEDGTYHVWLTHEDSDALGKDEEWLKMVYKHAGERSFAGVTIFTAGKPIKTDLGSIVPVSVPYDALPVHVPPDRLYGPAQEAGLAALAAQFEAIKAFWPLTEDMPLRSIQQHGEAMGATGPTGSYAPSPRRTDATGRLIPPDMSKEAIERLKGLTNPTIYAPNIRYMAQVRTLAWNLREHLLSCCTYRNALHIWCSREQYTDLADCNEFQRLNQSVPDWLFGRESAFAFVLGIAFHWGKRPDNLPEFTNDALGV